MRLRVDAGRQEALEAVTGAVDDAQRRVAGTGELRSRLDELLEERVERELRAQRDASVDEDAETVECGLLGQVPPGACDAQPRTLSGEPHCCLLRQ